MCVEHGAAASRQLLGRGAASPKNRIGHPSQPVCRPSTVPSSLFFFSFFFFYVFRRETRPHFLVPPWSGGPEDLGAAHFLLSSFGSFAFFLVR